MRKTALITGAGGGLGAEFARVLAREQYDLILVDLSLNRLRHIQKELEKHAIQTFLIARDLSLPNSAEDVFREVSGRGAHVEMLINNAGFGDYGLFPELSWEKASRMLQLNIVTLTHLTRLFLPPMLEKKRGEILNMSSLAAFQPGPLMAVYYATKAYILSFSEALGNELEGTGVKVCALCPGPVDTDFVKAAGMERSRMLERLPVADARSVAEYGIRSLRAGKRVAIYGSTSKLIAFIFRFLPRDLVTVLGRKIHG